MYSISAQDAYRCVMGQKDRNYHFPGKADERHRNGALFPHLYPKFQLTTRDRIFTLGSCFARHIEDALCGQGFQLPVKDFVLPEGEIPYPAPHLLNEYNAGTITQRLRSVLGQYQYQEGAGIEEGETGAIDLFLHIASQPVSLERLKARRKEIERLYSELRTCDCLVITLGLVEAWYDRECACYLNRAPAFRKIRNQAGRWEFHRFDPTDVVDLLRPVIHDLLDAGLTKVLLTVSPVPMEVSFMPGDIITNNGYSKSVLRTACELLTRNEPAIDYFPSYEIVTSFGVASGFIEDGVHPRTSVVQQVIAHLADHYLPWRPLTLEELEAIYASWADQGTRVLMYPAGSQSQDMLSRTPGLKRALVAFGDADPAKRTHPFLGLPVLAPEAISIDQVDLILVASDRYEDAICKDLKPVENRGIQLIRSSELSRRRSAHNRD